MKLAPRHCPDKTWGEQRNIPDQSAVIIKKIPTERRMQVSLNTDRLNHRRNVEQVHTEKEINVRWPWGRHFFDLHWYMLSILPLLTSLGCFTHDKTLHHRHCCTAMASILTTVYMNNFQNIQKFKIQNYLKGSVLPFSGCATQPWTHWSFWFICLVCPSVSDSRMTLVGK